ncbi:hypothetical protein ACHAWF_009438 [Thalassiosira exigua]
MASPSARFQATTVEEKEATPHPQRPRNKGGGLRLEPPAATTRRAAARGQQQPPAEVAAYPGFVTPVAPRRDPGGQGTGPPTTPAPGAPPPAAATPTRQGAGGTTMRSPSSPTPRTPTRSTTGFSAAFGRLGRRVHDPAFVTRELGWQGQRAPAQMLRDEVAESIIGAAKLKGFAFMANGKHRIKVLHSMQRFAHPKAGVVPNGTVVGFSGDRTEFANSMPMEPPKKKAWEWTSGGMDADRVQCATFYVQGENKDKLWTPPPGDGDGKMGGTVRPDPHHEILGVLHGEGRKIPPQTGGEDGGGCDGRANHRGGCRATTAVVLPGNT